MSRSLLVLSTLFMLAAGCRHANVPNLPASHGQLSLALSSYLQLPTKPMGAGTPSDTPEVVVEPAQAPAVFAEALRVLQGKPTAQELNQALVDLDAACVARFQAACDFLHEKFEPPVRLEGPLPNYPQEALATRTFAMVVVHCRLGVDGRIRDVDVLERAPYGFTEAVLASLRAARYRPALLAGHPIDVGYTLFIRMSPPGGVLTPEEEREWVRRRAEGFPRSVSAWFDLAEQLSRQVPEDPGYVPALQHLNTLYPSYWWAANELAWAHVQAGRYAEAAPLSRRARERASLNAYVLETSAATLFGLGQCAEAVAEQQSAVKGLPDVWPAPERERFRRMLQEYTQRCPAVAPANTPP